jgi:hypothetical protein
MSPPHFRIFFLKKKPKFELNLELQLELQIELKLGYECWKIWTWVQISSQMLAVIFFMLQHWTTFDGQ